MIIASASQFHVCLLLGTVVATFNQEKALEGASSVIVQFRRWIVCSTSLGLTVQVIGAGGCGLAAGVG